MLQNLAQISTGGQTNRSREIETHSMQQQEIDQLRALMEFEANRTEPPQGFPSLPDLPGGRYTDPRFYDLEIQQLWH